MSSQSDLYWIGSIVLLCLLCKTEVHGQSQDRSPASATQPNIVYIFADDLGYGEVGCYGQEKIKTPCIDQLAKEGMKFTQHYSGSPVCAPSRCTLLTGKHTGHAFVRDNKGKPVIGQIPIPENTETIGSVLQRSGYQTAVVGKWGLGGPNTTGVPNKQGFDFFYGYLDQWQAHSYYPEYLWQNDQKVLLPENNNKKHGTYSHDLITDAALSFVQRSRKEQPFFLYVAYTIPHVSLHVPDDSLKPYLGKWQETPYAGGHYSGHKTPRAAYAAMISRMDRDVGRIMAKLKAKGLDENTIVIFSSDNGPTYAGGVDHKFFRSAGPLRGLKGSLYEGGIRVPMIARWPNRIQADSTSHFVSACWDMLPTFAELARATPPDDIDGISLAPTLLGSPNNQKERPHLYWEYQTRMQAVRLGDWKAVRNDPNADLELFDLRKDIGETKNLAAANPDVVAEISKIMIEGRTPSNEFPLRSKSNRRQLKENRANQFQPDGLVDRSKWKLIGVDSESKFNGKLGQLAFDNDITTIWHTEWRQNKPGHPHHLIVDMGQRTEVRGIRYQARQDGRNGMIKSFEISFSDTLEKFGPVHLRGQFEAKHEVQEIGFKPITGRYFKFKTTSAHRGQRFASVAELGLLASKADDTIKVGKRSKEDETKSQGVSRRWLGKKYWGNRLQDWQFANDRIECSDESGIPYRTVHNLTHQLIHGQHPFSVSIELGSMHPERSANPESFVGLLLGSANSLVQNWQSPGFGLLVGVNGNGILRIGAELFALDPTSPTREWIELGAKIIVNGRSNAQGQYELELRLESPHSPQQSVTRTTTVDPEVLVGNIAFVSHSGKKAKGLSTGTDRFWFRNMQIQGDKIRIDTTKFLGPVVSTQYTLSQGTLKLTAQLMPIGTSDPQFAELQVQHVQGWKTIARTNVVYPGFTLPFRLTGWDSSVPASFRVKYDDEFWHGLIRKDPTEKETIVVAGFTGNHNNSHQIGRKDFDWGTGIWFPHADIVERVTAHNPDVLFFSGDQLYEGKSPTFADRKNIELDYLYKWYLWCWAYRDLTKDRPTVVLPDDHDVFQGNVWGQGGRQAKSQNGGGYLHGGPFIHLVENTQTSHLPDAFDPRPIEQNIPVRFTNMVYGRVSFAILEDRKFKTGCAGNGLPDTGTRREDHFNNPDFDVRLLDKPGLELLGARQLRFLRHWAGNWTGAEMKIALSQTIFANMATHHGPNLTHLIADLDSNGWPQSGRNRAISELRRGFAMHLAGDQHLATLVHHGVDEHDDAIWSFCVPSIANFYPRAWSPKNSGSYLVPKESEYKGRHTDGFGNLVTVHAATNPGSRSGRQPEILHDSMPGYGIVRINKPARQYTMECWPRYAKPGQDAQYPGWPLTISQKDNYSRKAKAFLPTLKISGMSDPVIRIYDNKGVLVYAYRLKTQTIRPHVFSEGIYTVELGEPDTSKLWRRTLSTTTKEEILVTVPK